MRTTKELLILLRGELPKMIKRFDCGMCLSITLLRKKRLMSYDEMILLFNYLNKNDPNIRYLTTDYWWEDGELEPRINWLNEQIEKL